MMLKRTHSWRSGIDLGSEILRGSQRRVEDEKDVRREGTLLCPGAFSPMVDTSPR